ncbi:thioredoxin [Cytophagaceae bacterium ABcell3]|nr:thioredoxin [Cytophagaceae bacterium ABcell3]
MSQKKSFKDLIQSDKPVLADFYADWCAPCKMLTPTLEQLSKESEDLKVVKIDVDKNPSAATQFGINGVPTLILFRKGKILWRKSGVMDIMSLRKELASHM